MYITSVHLHRTFIRNTLIHRKSRKSGTLYVCNRPQRFEVNSYLKTRRSGGVSIRNPFFLGKDPKPHTYTGHFLLLLHDFKYAEEEV